MNIKHISGASTSVNMELVLNCTEEEITLYLYLKLCGMEGITPTFTKIEGDMGWDDRKVKKVVQEMEVKKRLKVERIDGKPNVYDVTWYDLIASGAYIIKKSSKEQELEINNKNEGASLLLRSNNNYKQVNNIYNNIYNNNIDLNKEAASGLVTQKKPDKDVEAGKQAKQFLAFYNEKFVEMIADNKPIYNIPAAMKMAKTHIKNLGIDRLKELLIIYFNSEDDFIKKNCYSITNFLSAANLHKLVTQN